MQKKNYPILGLSLLVLLIVGSFCWYMTICTDYSSVQEENNPKLKELTIDPTQDYYYELKLPNETLHFNLVDPDQAPDSIKAKVKLGWKIMHQTHLYAKAYVGNGLYCTNCHFSSGNTFGGRNGSISLVGATNWYPAYSERDKKNITLQDRINNCFQRSMNGKPLPEGSKEMEAILAYLGWISNEVDGVKKTPWRGLIPLKTTHKPDTINGKKVYVEYCAPCHQPNGEGMFRDELQIPALWGDHSYNDGAGMNRLNLVSSFIYWNMPFQQPALISEDEALDVAQFLIEQQRPHFEPSKFEHKEKKQ
jgi:thiosulfate dehydrogenase